MKDKTQTEGFSILQTCANEDFMSSEDDLRNIALIEIDIKLDQAYPNPNRAKQKSKDKNRKEAVKKYDKKVSEYKAKTGGMIDSFENRLHPMFYSKVELVHKFMEVIQGDKKDVDLKMFQLNKEIKETIFK